jgi:phosphohistidine phosphatase
MILYLMRHGIAEERTDPDCPADPQRRLTPKGLERTRAAAAGLKATGAAPAAFLTSPYRRARETAEIAAEVFGFPAKKIIEAEALAPSGRPAELFRQLAEIAEHEVICFGHAPQLDETVAAALGSKRLVTALKKAGVAVLEVESFSPPAAALVALYPAKALRRLGG